jgi:methylmalonyl-CoA mutase N-terminal domain/subunit
VEQLTDELESSIWQLLEHIEGRGGALACIESGEFARELSDAAYRHTLAVESGDRVVVGVNRFPAEAEPLEVFRIDPASEAEQVKAVQDVRARRDAAAVKVALERLRGDVAEGRSVMPATIEAVRAYATIGEIVDVLRDAHGGWVPSSTF